MEQTEIIGYLVLGLISLLTLYNLYQSRKDKESDKNIETYKELSKAINDLNLLLEKLSTNTDNQEKNIEKLENRINRAEKKIQGIELNCAKNNHLQEQT